MGATAPRCSARQVSGAAGNKARNRGGILLPSDWACLMTMMSLGFAMVVRLYAGYTEGGVFEESLIRRSGSIDFGRPRGAVSAGRIRKLSVGAREG